MQISLFLWSVDILVVHIGSLGTPLPQAPGLPQALHRSPGVFSVPLCWARPRMEVLGVAATEQAWARICYHQP